VTESKNLIIPDFKQEDLTVRHVESNFETKIAPKEYSKNKKMKISTYSYGSNGKRWFYLSKLRKKQ
jgi:hypothetical protein